VLEKRLPLQTGVITVDFTNMPKGVRTAASATGLFKETTLNRGRAMPMADQTS
jgi:hypothetical protein